MAKKQLSEKGSTILKNFDIDFNELNIKLPDNSQVRIHIDEQLLINKDLPADILFKMSQCAATYGRYGMIRADLISYEELLKERVNVKMKMWKSNARKLLTGKPAEGYVEEKAVLTNIKEYKELKREQFRVASAIEKIKRVMRALEIQAEMARSISSYIKKEMDFTGDGDATFTGKNKFSNGG